MKNKTESTNVDKGKGVSSFSNASTLTKKTHKAKDRKLQYLSSKIKEIKMAIALEQEELNYFIEVISEQEQEEQEASERIKEYTMVYNRNVRVLKKQLQVAKNEYFLEMMASIKNSN